VRQQDLVIVGGGVAGGALAAVMARQGASVVVLERQHAYSDHVRGEILWPWGVRVARLLGLEQPLLDAGALVVRWLDEYDEGAPERERIDVGAVVEGVGGSLNITHPAACRALAEAAGAAGAEIQVGIRELQIVPGRPPTVRWQAADGIEHEVNPELVVGADGRRSTVRAQAGLAFEVDEPQMFFVGLLAGGIAGVDPQVNVIAREADLLFFSIPEEAGLVRLYFGVPADQRGRFSGRDAAQRFLAECTLHCVDGLADWQSATPAGPCATFPGENSRAPEPVAEGVVLVGDAAGYVNPLQGLGLGMALQDVHDVSAALLSDSVAERVATYVAGRAVRQRLAGLSVDLEIWANDGLTVQDPALRASRYAHIRDDEVLAALEMCPLTGFEALPSDLTGDGLAERLAPYRPSA
jgi:2-polyprenyl-6-methoxyphenol hydroxylase-like FAD-dependent oxidoreductase